MSTTVPEVIHLCDRCGDVASGACETCAGIDAMARVTVAGLLAEGASAPTFDPLAVCDERELVWRAAVTQEFHRQRSARLYGSLPRVGGQMARRWSAGGVVAWIIGCVFFTLALIGLHTVWQWFWS